MYLTLDTICSKLKFNPVEKYSSELAHSLLTITFNGVELSMS